LNTRLIEYFVAVAENGSFNKAADLCGVSQPALSIQLKKFEQELGIELFERTTKSVILTPAGDHILNSAREILTRVKSLKIEAHLFADPYSGDMHLGAFPTLAPSLFPRLIPELIETYPNIHFHLVEEKTEVLLDALLSGKLDAAFLAEPISHPHLNVAPLYNEHFLLAMPENYPLSDFVEMKDLANSHLMLLEEGHCLREQALEACRFAGLDQVADFSASSMTTLLHMVQLGNGSTLIPERSIQKIPGVKYLKFRKNPPGRSIALVWRKSSIRKDILLEIADDFKKSLI
jgi:LysR family transcriptional regulator, hydrogen peroxide-inducible genes activator